MGRDEKGEMATKVHYKSYIREDDLVKGLDNDRNGSWSMFYDGRNLNRHLDNDFRLIQVNGYSAYDKEMLKRTMLEHEAIFRKQVCELHRLYRIQKSLMDGLKRRDLYGYSIPMNASHTSPLNSFSSQIPLDDQQKNLHLAHMANGNGFCWRVSTVGLVDARDREENRSVVRSRQSSVENGDSLKDDQLLESKSNNKFCRRTFDLELPADVYIDDEEIERSENDYAAESSFRAVDFLNRSHSLETKNNVKLTLGHGEHSVRGYDSRRSKLKLKSELPVSCLSDLKGPVRECSEEGASGSTSYYFGPRNRHVDIRENRLTTLRTTPPSFLREHYLKHKCKDDGASSNFSRIDMEETGQESPFLGTDSGVILSDVNKREHWSEQKPLDSIDLSVGNLQLHSFKRVVAEDPPKTNMFVRVPSDHRGVASPLDLSLRKPKNRISRPPIAVQALPCFNTCAAMNLVHNGDYRSSLKPGTEPFSCPNGLQKSSGSDLIFYSNHPSVSSQKQKRNNSSTKSASRTLEGHRPQKCLKFSHCKDVNSLKDLNLNQPLSRENQDSSLIADQGINESSEGLSWLRKETSCDESVRVNTSKMEINASCRFPHLLSSFTALDAEFDRKIDNEKASDLQTFPSTTGFPVLEKIQQSSTCSLSVDHRTEYFTDDTKFNQGGGLHYSKDCKLTLDRRDSRSEINLNSLMTCLENPKSLHVVATKLALEIDLEAPVSCQLEDISPIISMLESSSTKKQSCNTDCSKETEDLHDRCIREAAESIISMSLDMHAKTDDLACHTLHWLAETVSSNAEKELKRGAEQVSETLNDDKLDLFELMTLKLEETKENEYWCQTQEPVNSKDERKCTAASLLTRPRRGQGRKRRRRRDFQKDILPGLASLTRHEVTEDLKVIRGLLMDSGCSWQMSSTRRNRNRTRTGTGARGRQRVRSKPVTMMPEINVSPPAVKPTNAELEVNRKGMVGWGRTTRRCHRLRCSTGDGNAFV